MAVRAVDIFQIIEERAPRDLACDWDNVGLQVGDPSVSVDTVLMALDFTLDVLNEAKRMQAQMVVVHHPVIFTPLRVLNTEEPLVELLAETLSAGVVVYAAHTNLDAAAEGVSTVLANRLQLKDIQPLPRTTMGRGGSLPLPMSLAGLVEYARERLSLRDYQYFGPDECRIEKVAVCGGSGGDLVKSAVDFGAQILITGDIGYHDLLEARARGLCLMDAGHAQTEEPAVDDLAAYLKRRFRENNMDIECRVSASASPEWMHPKQRG